jgi:hypothetical protein
MNQEDRHPEAVTIARAPYSSAAVFFLAGMY